MLNKLGIRGKLILMCFALASFSVIIGVGNYITASHVNPLYEKVGNENLPGIQSIEQMQSYYRRARIYVTLLGLPEVTAEQATSFMGEAEKALENYDKSEKIYTTAPSRTMMEIAGNLSSGADEVASASTEIASSSEELSASVTEQAAALQETAASIEEMSAMIAKNTESCAKTKNLSDQSQASATDGKKIVEDMIRAIEAIHRSNTEMTTEIEASNQEISDIIKVIAEIGNKTKVINDIVFQTKLLSFNASVEAARAGEHGKGFAVVAEEVGNLAQMSGNAAKEISSMLDGSIAKVESIVTNTKTKVERLVATGKEKVESGSEIAKRCGEVLDVIVSNVETVNLTVNEISTASQEQDHGVKEVAKAMSQLDQTTQQNSTATQHAASAAEQLSSQANMLRTSVAQLMATVQGSGAATSGTPAFQKQSKTTHHVADYGVSKAKKPSASSARASSNKVVSMKERSNASESVPSNADPRFEDVA